MAGYSIVEQLYLGSRTAVYRAIQTATQRPVVVKVLRRDYPSFGELVQFRNQFTIAKNLSLPGIVQPLSLEPLGSGYALVMEDWGGVALGQYLQSHPLDWREVLEITLQLADILHGLSQNRVVHKDIKPANILIHPESKQVKLIDFSIASLLSKETQEIQSPNILEGTLSYIAPEQTGRMNRGIDYRADFYALGVTLYQLLTGTLPFVSDDPLELMHCHLAQVPLPAHQVKAEIPQIVAAIVAKLMAKNAEDRYQSSLGLKHDLEQCLRAWKATGNMPTFELGQHDLSDRFLIPEKLYGRAVEVQSLLEAFDRVANGSSELMLVAGFSGIGKTAVVNEVHKPIVRQRGYFIKGKFDQFNRNIPLSAFVQALRDLMGQLLSESDAQLTQWQAKILAALGENGQVLIDVIPELEQIIGQQPIAPELSGSAAQNRFNLLFQKFIEVFTTTAHPLVIFLDDLQWADLASLQLLKLLIDDNGYLLILGAYRDNEVSPTHPFSLTVKELKKAQTIVNTITLAPLAFENTNHLIADTLNCSLELAQPLTELVDRKTQGNPFFTTQFLKALYEDGYIRFDRVGGASQNKNRCYWECDIDQVQALTLTNDVVEFMAVQLQKFPPETQLVIQLAACIGNQFDLATLAIISEQSPTDVAAALWKVLQEGLILPMSQVYKFFQSAEQSDFESCAVNPTYRFLHDRVQQAAYSLIPEVNRTAIHYRIGRLLVSHFSSATQAERIFEIVSHLNISSSLIDTLAEQIDLARLNLIAGRKAISSNAYGAALEYLNQAIDLLPDHAWTDHYAFTLELHHQRLDVAYLNTHFEDLEAWGKIVLQQATSLLDQIKVYETRIMALRSQGRFLEVVETGLQVLRLLGIEFPAQPTPADIGAAYEQSRQSWQERAPLSLLNLPAMQDPQLIAAMQIMSKIVPSAHIAAPPLLPLLSFKQVELSIQYGNSPISIFSYADYGLILCGIIGDVTTGYKFGQLALALLEKLQISAFKSRAYFIVNSFTRHWQEPLHHTIPLLLEGYRSGLESGDWECVALNLLTYSNYQYWAGQELNGLAEEMVAYRDIIQQVKQEATLKSHEIYLQAILGLLGQSEVPYRLQGTVFDAEQSVPLLQAANDRVGLLHVYINQALLCYLFGQDEQAVYNAARVEEYRDAACGFFLMPIGTFYSALIQLKRYPDVLPEEQTLILEQVEADQVKLQNWATHAPFNHQHRWQLIAAEQSRILNQRAEAIEYYDLAIASAKANGFTQEEALANELAAKFYLGWGKPKIAQEYLTNAYYGYVHWGAKAKVQDLECRYPTLLAPILQQQKIALSATETVFDTASLATPQTTVTKSSSSSGTGISATLDLASILKASQTLSSEIELDKLLATLLHTVLENSGADKGALLMPRDNQWFVEAIATLDQPAWVQSIALSSSSEIPHGLINTVKRSLQPAVIMDATIHPTLAMDAYVMQHQPKSLLCTPILQQGKLVAILYLENHITVGVFTSDRVELLNCLCAQAAISLENARLYQQAQEDAQQLQRKEAQSRGIFEAVSDGLLITDLETGKVMDANPAYYQLHGYSYSEILSLDPLDFIPPNRHDKFTAFLKTVKVGQEFTCEAICKKRDGTPFYIELKAVPFLYNGKRCGLSVIRDVTERKYMELSIQEKNRTLEQAMAELQHAQMKMIQSEKMSALGNLVAGVAHEINNPIGFLNGSINNTKEYTRNLLGHLALYQQHHPNAAAPIQDNAEEIDLEFLSEDLPKLLESMKGATDRIKGISTSLRTFSRADTDYKIRANLHEGIDSTLLILKYRLKANEHRPAIEVIQDYGDVPTIQCFPGQLNQVFMNILANAIDIFDEMAQDVSFAQLKSHPQHITIRTTTQAKQVQIQISDNGKGMTEDVRTRIFDHLFTTKGVSKGTGLGLTIARQIVVEKHSGSLEVYSELGQGTEFCIRLPIVD
ncbi:AAA family ATPase [Leptolyngbya sp. PCC 6406]|uniref:ATP-binding sensor histidine kinase n=1 Tax=Leptolyngbya sp. PCC 6406 TaxID=1173264 RepID=UPI0002AC0C4A|nr:AAA family ATPase [Leptolyngbya sp. PCC 6406]